MNHDDLVQTFGQSVGVEKAESLVIEALAEVGLEPAERYSDQEIADVCETIARSSDGYVRVVANEIRVRQQAKRRFGALLDEISDPVVTVSLDGSEPVVEAVNPAFEETFGYDAEIAVGEPLPALIVPAEKRDRTVDCWLRSNGVGSEEVQRVTADGERRTFLFRSVVVSGFDGDVEAYGIYTDITERERRERRLKLQNEQLERFASVVSHDLRNPMMVAQGNLELALQGTSDPEVRENLERVADAHDRMEQLVGDLLELASQGRTVDDPNAVALSAVVAKAWRNVNTEAAALVVTAPADLVIRADEGRLCQLFENLFRNAVEHGSTSPASQARQDAVEHGIADAEHAEPAAGTEGVEEVSAGDPAITRGPDDPAVTIRIGWADELLFVEDDGPGIPPAERDAVFEHGYSNAEDGTGFGLAITQAIAEAHGWTVGVTDGTAGGARFEFRGVQSVVTD